jgi:PAS domain S-box-containing protein
MGILGDHRTRWAQIVRKLLPVQHATSQWTEESQTRELLEAAPDSMITADPAGVIRIVNRRAERQFGYSREELIGQQIEILMPMGVRGRHPDLRAGYFRHPHARAMGSGLGLAARRKDGSEFPCDIALSPLETPDGLMVIAAVRDVTEQHRAAAALRESEARYRGIVENALMGILALDAQGRIAYANPHMGQLLGVLSTELAGRSALEFAPPEQRASIPLLLQHRMQGLREAFEGDMVRADGAVRRVRISAVPKTDEFGRPAGSIAMVIDLTEERRAQAALRESEARHRNIVESSLVGVWTVDARFRISFSNRRFAEMLGTTPEQLIGRPVLDLVVPEERNEAQVRQARRMAGIAEVHERGYLRLDGKPVTVQISSVPLFAADGTFAGATNTVLDLTERRNLEQQLLQAQKMEAVGRLAGGVAHDFNNMLTVIMGYAALLNTQIAPEDSRHAAVEQIQRAAQRSEELTRRLLAFSRKQVLRPRIVAINAAIRDMEPMLQRLLGEDSELLVRLGAASPPVRVDPGQLEQVMMNLTVNASDAMPGGGRLTVESSELTLERSQLREQADAVPGRYVLIAVSDTGIGMDKATQEHIFEPFFTTKELGKGTGLGLSTVYGIVRQSGGYVRVQSEPGQGATFQIFLPVADGGHVAVPESLQLQAAPGGSETILLVEDEEAVRTLVRLVLTDGGYRVLEASGPREALALHERYSGSIHLLLTDVAMPEMSGRELAERLRPLAPGMKVIFMSGYTEDAVLRNGAFAPGTAFLSKPVLPADLKRKVRGVLDS